MSSNDGIAVLDKVSPRNVSEFAVFDSLTKADSFRREDFLASSVLLLIGDLR